MKYGFVLTILILVGMCLTTGSPAQVGIGTNNPDASSGLDVNFVDKGFLAPRMTSEQREAIENPAEGLIIFNTTTGCINYFHGNAWYEWCGTLVPFNCGTSKVRFLYNGNPVSYGTVTGANDKCWLDRNLGASQVATSSTDEAAFGDLFQWGRLTDGHQVRTSSTSSVLSSSDVPGHGNYIYSNATPYDWRSPQNNYLWQGINGINNPCPDGFRIPRETEMETERLSWTSNDANGAFNSSLKLPMAGSRYFSNGTLYGAGTLGYYWTSVVNSNQSAYLLFNSTNAFIYNANRADGLSVRCIMDTDLVGTISYLNCEGSTITGTLTEGIASVGVSASISYEGGNGGSHGGQIVGSSGVTGLTAYLYPGVFSVGTGTLVYFISGTPSTSGTATFAINIGEQICDLEITVENADICGSTVSFTYNGNSVTYGTVASFNNKCWLDRNLGASQIATSSTDGASFGDLFQWGRLDDGHQIRTSSTTSSLSSGDVPGHNNFILSPTSPNDWRNPQNNNLWQGVSSTNNPCPSGFRLPTQAEWDAERGSWGTNNASGAFTSPLKLTVGGYRNMFNGVVYQDGTDGYGYYCSSSINSGINSMFLIFGNSNAGLFEDKRANGMSVRCVKD